MPADNAITVLSSYSGQGSPYTVQDPARPRAAERVDTPDSAQDTKRQDLSVSEQNLPPGNTNQGEKQLQQAVSDINSYVQNMQRDLRFQVDSELGETIISVVDSETNEVIRQIPSEEVLQRARHLREQEGEDRQPEGLLLKVKI